MSDRQAGTVKTKESAAQPTLADHLANEAYAFGDGLLYTVGGIGKAIKSAEEHPLDTAMKVGVSTALGIGLGYLSSRTGWVGIAGRSLGLAAGLSFLYDGVAPICKTWGMAWNANNSNDLENASQYFGNNVGAFLVDTAIQTPGALLGTRFGANLKFGLERGAAPGEVRETAFSAALGDQMSTAIAKAADITSFQPESPTFATAMDLRTDVLKEKPPGLATDLTSSRSTIVPAELSMSMPMERARMASTVPGQEALTESDLTPSMKSQLQSVLDQMGISTSDAGKAGKNAPEETISPSKTNALVAANEPVLERSAGGEQATTTSLSGKPEFSATTSTTGVPKFDQEVKTVRAERSETGSESRFNRNSARYQRSDYRFSQVVPQRNNQPPFDLSLAVKTGYLKGDKPEIPTGGTKSLVQQMIDLPADQLPANGSHIAVETVDTEHVLALAALRNRVEQRPIDFNLIKVFTTVANGGTIDSVKLPAEGTDARLAFHAVDATVNAPDLGLFQKINFASDALSGKLSEDALKAQIDRFGIHSVVDQPFRYVQVRPRKPAKFDYGVEITSPELLKGQPNLDHHGAGVTADMPSASEQALLLKAEQLPALNARVAIEKPDADSLTAVAVMANRKAGMPVDERVVSAIGRRDRGVSTGLEETGSGSSSNIESSFNAIRSFARDRRMTIGQRVTAIREVLAGKADQERLDRISDRLKQNQEDRIEKLKQTATVDIPVPSKLAVVHSPRDLWFDARNYGLKHAPVTLVSLEKGGYAHHYNVVSEVGNPTGRYMDRALVKFSSLEQGWAGRPNIFVSPDRSGMAETKVVDLLKYYIDPPTAQRVLWDGQDYVTKPEVYIGMVNGTSGYVSAAGVSQFNREFAPAAVLQAG